MELTQQIRRVLESYGRLVTPVEEIGDLDDLYVRGLTSHASVNVMLALEETFEVEFLDSMLTRATFESIGSMRAALVELGVADGASPAARG
ncbi:MAG TPA: acyl carrier protein [Acidimicrobiales bacterium]|nr:acyl carrier protein [Acidimicrobiales bacterium]